MLSVLLFALPLNPGGNGLTILPAVGCSSHGAELCDAALAHNHALYSYCKRLSVQQ
jgi:hypothetical protein